MTFLKNIIRYFISTKIQQSSQGQHTKIQNQIQNNFKNSTKPPHNHSTAKPHLKYAKAKIKPKSLQRKRVLLKQPFETFLSTELHCHPKSPLEDLKRNSDLSAPPPIKRSSILQLGVYANINVKREPLGWVLVVAAS